MKDKLTKEQSAHLIELRVSADKASYHVGAEIKDNKLINIFTFTLADVLELLPKEIYFSSHRYSFSVFYDRTENGANWFCDYTDSDNQYAPETPNTHAFELIDALYELLCWTIKTNILSYENN